MMSPSLPPSFEVAFEEMQNHLRNLARHVRSCGQTLNASRAEATWPTSDDDLTVRWFHKGDCFEIETAGEVVEMPGGWAIP